MIVTMTLLEIFTKAEKEKKYELFIDACSEISIDEIISEIKKVRCNSSLFKRLVVELHKKLKLQNYENIISIVEKYTEWKTGIFTFTSNAEQYLFENILANIYFRENLTPKQGRFLWGMYQNMRKNHLSVNITGFAFDHVNNP